MIKIGDTLSLELKQSNKEEKYKSKVLDIKGNQMYIDYPVSQKTRKIGIFLEGTQFKGSFIAKDSAVYVFDTEVQGRKKLDNIPVVVLELPEKDKFVKIQRREFVRVETALDVAIHPLNNEFQPFTTVTVDISAGGAAILLPKNHRLTAEMKVTGYFVLPFLNGDFEYVKGNCKVIRIISGDQKKDKAPLQFIDISESERQAITRLCFDRQLEMRKKGLR